MSNLENFNNIYADLSESSYNSRPSNFPYDQLKPSQKKDLDSGKSVKFDFSQDVIKKDSEGNVGVTQGGTDLPNDGKVHLQPDATLHTVSVKTDLTVPNPNGGYHTESYVTSTYQKGLFTDGKTGFSSYFVTNNPDPKKSTQAYLAIRGSDSISSSLNNDWLKNNLPFAVGADEIPQAKDAAKAIQGALKKLPSTTPLNITGHSLGTMVSVQGAAQLIKKNPSAINQLGNLVLFDGPDPTQSLKNMGLSEKQLKQLKQLSKKTTYYVNPLDMVSMLNRTEPLKDQFGHVKVIVPTYFTMTMGNPKGVPSSHDFGAFQINDKGQPLVASKTIHPELLKAGQTLAKLESSALKKLKALGLSDSASLTLLSLVAGGGNPIEKGEKGFGVVKTFQKEYEQLVESTRKASKAWDETRIPNLQSQIRGAGETQKIALRAELLETVSQKAVLKAQEDTTDVNTLLSTAKAKIRTSVDSGRQVAYSLARYLDPSEVEELLADFNMSTFWDESIEAETKQEAQCYQGDMEQFSANLLDVSKDLQTVDNEGAANFEAYLSQTRQDGDK